ncbi:hypothetical protein EPN18_04500 [bacterium]|nr:MAG: hypothetical protein EPN18_04500 [bacterium]
MDKTGALKMIMALADEHGIPYIFFDTKEEAEMLLQDMRWGYSARKTLDNLGIKLPEPPLI